MSEGNNLHVEEATCILSEQMARNVMRVILIVKYTFLLANMHLVNELECYLKLKLAF